MPQGTELVDGGAEGNVNWVTRRKAKAMRSALVIPQPSHQAAATAGFLVASQRAAGTHTSAPAQLPSTPVDGTPLRYHAANAASLPTSGAVRSRKLLALRTIQLRDFGAEEILIPQLQAFTLRLS